MPISSMNKVVSLFLVGTLAMGWLAAMWWTELLSFLLSAQQPAIAVASVLSIPLAGAAGVAIDGVADILVRPYIRRSRTRPTIGRFFRQADVLTSFKCWRLSFDKARASFSRRRPNYLQDLEPGVTSQDVASGIFLSFAPSQLFEWVTSHYAVYCMATSSSVVLMLGISIPVRLATSGNMRDATLLLLAIVGLVYALLSVALDRYLYSYESIFRFATLWLDDDTRNPAAETSSTARTTVQASTR